jgi:hypothetical protein
MLKKIVFVVAFSVLNIGAAIAACDPRAPQVNPNFKLPPRRIVKGEGFNVSLGLLSWPYSDETSLFVSGVHFPASKATGSNIAETGLSVHAYLADGHTPCNDPKQLCYAWITGTVSNTAMSTTVDIHAASEQFPACEDQVQHQQLIVVPGPMSKN